MSPFIYYWALQSQIPTIFIFIIIITIIIIIITSCVNITGLNSYHFPLHHGKNWKKITIFYLGSFFYLRNWLTLVEFSLLSFGPLSQGLQKQNVSFDCYIIRLTRLDLNQLYWYKYVAMVMFPGKNNAGETTLIIIKEERFEDTKGVIKSCKSEKRCYDGQQNHKNMISIFSFLCSVW
jgi:hypothetical protein